MEKSNNFATLKGMVTTLPKVSHTLMEEKFYCFTLSVKRLSGSVDEIIVTIPEKLHLLYPINEGDLVEISGQYRSYNNYSGIGNKLILTLFAHEICYINEEDTLINPNSIYLNGYICKQPVYRTTPFGREITDIILAVNRSYGKSDYIPCITWGRNAKYSSALKVGDNIEIEGRIQSRNYQKKLSDDEIVTKTAFEISVSKINLYKQEEDE